MHSSSIEVGAQSHTDEMPRARSKTILRVARRQHFTQIPNDLARSTALSPQAVGILIFILSYPDDWTFTKTWLMRVRGIKRDRVDAILKELEGAGYCRHHQVRQSDGKAGSCEYRFADTPMAEEQLPAAAVVPRRGHSKPKPEKPVTVSPQPENPQPAQPQPENPHPTNTVKRTNTDKDEYGSAEPPSASPAPGVKHCFTNKQHEDEAVDLSNDAASQHGFSKVSARTLDDTKVEFIEPEVIPIPLKPVKTAPAKGKGRANGKRKWAQRSERGTRLPEDWSLTQEDRERTMRVWGLTEAQVTRIERAFRNYWTSQPGQKGVKLNWGRTLENWIDRDHARVGEEGARPPTARTRPSAEDQLHAAFGERS